MPITDEQMQAELATTRDYAVVILRKVATPPEGVDARALIWEHGRRNFELRARGVLNVVLAVRDESNVSGIGVFDATADEAAQLMRDDPAVQAGLFTFEIHTGRGFPADALAAG